MNTRLLNFLLIVQLIFAGALIYIGVEVREKRKQDYLELTRRVTAGFAGKADFNKLLGFIPERAEKAEIRSLFGLPVLRAEGVEIIDDAGKRTAISGETWLYYFAPEVKDPGNPPALIDSPDAAKLAGPQTCFVVSFDKRGRANSQIATVNHPVQTLKP